MTDPLIALLESQGAQTVVDHLTSEKGDQTRKERLTGLDAAARHAYWQMKDLPAAVLLYQAGIAYGQAQSAAFPAEAQEIDSMVKTMCYNLASFTWPGWDEEGMVIDEELAATGLEAAWQNLHLAQVLGKDDLPVSRAYWMLGAQEMAAKTYEAARTNFARAAQHAQNAGAQGEVLLARGFLYLAHLLEDAENAPAQAGLEKTKTALQDVEDGQFYIQQIEDAQRVFG